MSFFQGFGAGLAGMFGLGSLYNPLKSKQDELAAAQQNLQKIMMISPLVAQKLNTEITDDMITVMTAIQTSAASALQLQTTLIWNQINKDQIVGGMVAMIVLALIIFFLMIKWTR